ncbi:MAG: PhnD/SsuA/transferrin family substrate-binding protein [Bryobacteraceae bacterium]|jgi:phosphonate transport system substrate-binding protein
MKLLRAHPRWFSLVMAAGCIWLCWFVAVASVASGAALAQQNTAGRATGTEAHGLRHALLRGVASSRVFNNVNRNDARAALKVWFDVVAQQRGYILDSTVDVLDSVTEIRQRLESHSAELVMLGVTDYLELESSGLIVPVLTDARSAQGGAFYSYVLLVNPSSGATTMASLRGKNILVGSRGAGKTGMAWLEVVLGKEKFGRAAPFFASIKAPDKAQACILPLFFGSVDACVVDEVSLNLAKEMNPQLGQLRVLARSRPLIESVIATPVESRPYQKELIDAMLSLHEDPRGRQLLMVFKTDRLVRIQPGDLESARELWRDYHRLPGSPPLRPASFAPTAESNQADRGKERN